jgi:phage shock protein A
MDTLSRIPNAVQKGIRSIFEPAEDPRKAFADAYSRQRDLLLNVQRALTDIESVKTKLEMKLTEVESKLPEIKSLARMALRDQGEDSARVALQRYQIATMELETLKSQIDEVGIEEKRMSLVEQQLTTQIEAFFARQEVIYARYNAFEAEMRINEALTGVSKEISDLDIALKHAEDKTKLMQARAVDVERLIVSDVGGGIAGYAKLLENYDLDSPDVQKRIDEQLEALKRELK